MIKNKELNELINKEWIITNGLGGYASSTICGANTRKYHGLLVAPLTPPARRHLILSKIDESITINNKNYNLYTNMCSNYISDGYKYLVDFEKQYVPKFTFNVNGIKIEKTICMKYRENTVCILYKIHNGKEEAKLNLAPIVNFRDFHCVNSNHSFNIRQNVNNTKVKVIVDRISEHPIYIKCSDGEYNEHFNDTFKDMYYIEEEKRGFEATENHAVTGVYTIEIKPNEEKNISIVCSLEENIDEIDAKTVINNEIKRLDKIISNTNLIYNVGNGAPAVPKKVEKNKFIKDLIIATDNFVVFRPSFILHTVIAGYPWFLDWGRDALISFEGLLLVTKRFDIAKEVLMTFVKNIKYGLVPNGYSGFDNRPLYNSVDSSLLLFEQINKYINYTGDYEFIKDNLYKTLVQIIECYQSGIDVDNNNIYVDKDNLLVSGTEKTQNTWMDAKYGDYAVTPRNGKAVEINAMWYNALKILEDLSKKFEEPDNAKKYAKMARATKTAFNEKFYNPKKKCLYDVLGDSKIRPNQLFALSLTYPIIDVTSNIAKEIMNTVTKKLLNKYGIKTLAKDEDGYVEEYSGDSYKRDTSYHQGITWVWLLGLYFDSYKNMISKAKTKAEKEKLQKELDKFAETTYKTFKSDLYNQGIIGSIAEIYDSKTPQLPKGALAQAWSVAEVLRITMNI